MMKLSRDADSRRVWPDRMCVFHRSRIIRDRGQGISCKNSYNATRFVGVYGAFEKKTSEFVRWIERDRIFGLQRIIEKLRDAKPLREQAKHLWLGGGVYGDMTLNQVKLELIY